MDDKSKELLVQAAVMGLQMVFTNLKLAGKSDDEIHQMFVSEKIKFAQNRPDLLPDV
jgi:hypothetical protein